MSDLSQATWRKSSFSDVGGNCVEVDPLPDGTIAVRNSKRPEAGSRALHPSRNGRLDQGLQSRRVRRLGVRRLSRQTFGLGDRFNAVQTTFSVGSRSPQLRHAAGGPTRHSLKLQNGRWPSAPLLMVPWRLS